MSTTNQGRKKKTAIKRLIEVAGYSNRHAIMQQAATMTVQEINDVRLALMEDHGNLAARKAVDTGKYITLPATKPAPQRKHSWWKIWRGVQIGKWKLKFTGLYHWMSHYSSTEKVEWHAWARVTWSSFRRSIKKA